MLVLLEPDGHVPDELVAMPPANTNVTESPAIDPLPAVEIKSTTVPKDSAETTS